MILKNILSCGVLMVVAGCLATGCQSRQASPPYRGDAALETRNNSYSLLYQLLDEQKDVSLLRFIKREHPELKTLIQKIAMASGKGAKLLKEFARQDPAINLEDLRLPPGEVATREAIGATKQKELLSQSGAEFELSLLLTQTEALSYAWHLAEVTRANEPDPERARALATLGAEMKTLNHEVSAMLLARTKLPAAN